MLNKLARAATIALSPLAGHASEMVENGETKLHELDAPYWALPDLLSHDPTLTADLYSTTASYLALRTPPPARPRRVELWAEERARNAVRPGSAEHMILDFVGQLEAPHGYDEFFRGANPKPPKPLTEMTVAEVRDWQRNAADRSNYSKGAAVSSAAGRYQIISGTFKQLVEALDVPDHALFDSHLQDQMALHLLTEIGLHEFKEARMSIDDFGHKVATVWASLPTTKGANKGKSVYDRYNGNHHLIDLDSYKAMLSEAQKAGDGNADL